MFSFKLLLHAQLCVHTTLLHWLRCDKRAWHVMNTGPPRPMLLLYCQSGLTVTKGLTGKLSLYGGRQRCR